MYQQFILDVECLYDVTAKDVRYTIVAAMDKGFRKLLHDLHSLNIEALFSPSGSESNRRAIEKIYRTWPQALRRLAEFLREPHT